MTGLRVYPRHACNLGICAKGQRRWARSVGLDYASFARHGMPVDEFARIEHPSVARIIEEAEREAQHERR